MPKSEMEMAAVQIPLVAAVTGPSRAQLWVRRPVPPRVLVEY
jgi:hypothetical protein